jgi:predicted aspartyl protease
MHNNDNHQDDARPIPIRPKRRDEANTTGRRLAFSSLLVGLLASTIYACLTAMTRIPHGAAFIIMIALVIVAGVLYQMLLQNINNRRRQRSTS